jgi:glycosyltransferase involved in cell wall biosynthesis
MENDLISVILAVYNGEKTLNEAIDSILNQTYKNIEIILVNDGSTDNSLEIIKNYNEKYNNVIVVSKPNGGLASARNAGLKASTGKYICFCDADDKYDESFVEIMHRNIIDDDVDWVSCNRAIIKGKKLNPKPLRMKGGIYEHKNLTDILIDDGTLSGILVTSNCTKIYKQSIIKEHNLSFDESVKTSQDGVFNINYFLHTKKIKFIDDAVYLQRPTPFSGKKRFEESDIFGPADTAIFNMCSGKIANISEQMNARRVSAAIWSIMIYSNKYQRKTAFTAIKKIVFDKTLHECYGYIKVSKLSRNKRMAFTLLKSKRYKILFYVFNIREKLTK